MVCIVIKIRSSKWWRSHSAFKSPGYSSRGPGFNSQHSHEESQPSVLWYQEISYALLSFSGSILNTDIYSGDLTKNFKKKVCKNLKSKVLTGLLWWHRLPVSVIRDAEAEGQKGKANLGNLIWKPILKNK